MTRFSRNLVHTILVAIAGSLMITGCASDNAQVPTTNDSTVDAVSTTPIIADLVSQVAGDRARVISLMPLGADPHNYEPGLRNIRNIANADIVFANGLLLEQHSLLTTAQHVKRVGVPFVELAEQAPRHGGELLPLVENIALDTVWFGMRIGGQGQALGASRNSGVDIALSAAEGPGHAAAYITSTFGTPEILFNTRDGIDAADQATLPVDAHTHVSWAFSKPGYYRLNFSATLNTAESSIPVDTSTVTFAVGVDPHSTPGIAHPVVLDHGHMDLTADLDQARMTIRGDAPEGIQTDYDYDPERSVVAVPSSVLQQIPGDPTFRFLGTAGEETYLLPQAVLGKHVHGEVDPHVWHSVANAIAMVRVIQDELTAIDPGGRDIYRDNADRYVDSLQELDQWMRASLSTISPHRRHLVTTHDAYGYLGHDYDLNIAGFVTPNPAVEASPRDVIALTRTLENLQVPAVFLEPKLAGRSGVLTETAATLDIAVCTIRGDTLDSTATNYIDLMRSNVEELRRCLG
ncbi:anchored repeat ABC transporter, substrate-binding protein [Corynebacterium sp. ES2775-CONJ]|uniref:anchored repeat ABC transporter, substrate-binding protein n=1 Tax=Corynebacterium sp. ES2775-CONJ TaxID=2974029 RepID=UPI0037BEA3EF